MTTAQQLFDTIVTRIIEQGQASWHDGSCRYRSPDGCVCAVGAVLNDDEYQPSMEGKSMSVLKTLGQVPARLAEHAALLEHLQIVHDRNAGEAISDKQFVHNFEQEARSLAAVFNLDPSCIDAALAAQGNANA